MDREAYNKMVILESYCPYSKSPYKEIGLLKKIYISILQRIKGDYIQLYQRYMRRCEYYSSKRGPLNRAVYIYSFLKLKRLSSKTGISIYPAKIGEGLTIFHHGSIVVNGKTKIGKNCCIHNNVNIGSSGGSDNVPTIGDNVYIGPGAVIFGKITIADNCFIGANSVVCKSILEPDSVVVGAPAKVIKKSDHIWWEENNFKREK